MSASLKTGEQHTAPPKASYNSQLSLFQCVYLWKHSNLMQYTKYCGATCVFFMGRAHNYLACLICRLYVNRHGILDLKVVFQFLNYVGLKMGNICFKNKNVDNQFQNSQHLLPNITYFVHFWMQVIFVKGFYTCIRTITVVHFFGLIKVLIFRQKNYCKVAKIMYCIMMFCILFIFIL